MLSASYIQKIVGKYLKQLPIKVEFAILYGSSICGERLRDSDIDLIIVSDDFKEMPFEQRMSMLQKNWKHEVTLEAFGFTTTEFNKLKYKSIVVQEANEKGVKIYT